MGNGQSSNDTNIPSSHSFLSNKRSSAKTKGKVIVVKQRTNAAGPSCSKNDDMIKRFLEIPKFCPILKSSLNQPGLHDLPEAIFKINPRPVLKFAYRLQEHLSRCANIVIAEQESLGNLIKDIDRSIGLLLVQLSDRKKSLDCFQNYIEKIDDLQAHISNLRFLFQDLMPAVETLNEILPEQKRLPLLNIDCLINVSNNSLDREQNEIIRKFESNTCSVDSNQDDLHIKPVDEIQKSKSERISLKAKIDENSELDELSNISFVGMDTSMFQMKPIETKQIVAFVNYFMVTNVQMLQSFVSDVEQRFIDMEKRLSRVEVELKLLELKLDSVPGLQITVPKVNELSVDQQYDGPLSNRITMEDSVENETVDNAKVVDSESLLVSNFIATVERPHESIVSESSSTKQNHCLRIRDDPRYAVYFKMLKMGVPECAVKQKMASQGIDAALLQTPDALSDFLEDATASIEEKGSTSADDDDQNSTSSSER